MYLFRYIFFIIFVSLKNEKMKTITVSDFRKDIKKYSELAESEKIIVNRGSGKAFLVVPINTIQDKGYSEEFVANLLAAEQQIKEEKSTKISSKKELNDFLKNL